MNPIFRTATRGLWPALPVLLLSSVASAQSGAMFEFDSAVDSHRRLNDDSAPPPRGAGADDTVAREASRVDPEGMTESASRERGAEPAGDRPAPLDPTQAMAADADERRTVPSVRDPHLRHDSALEGYAGYDESNAPGWGEANERVGEIGGWREYAKELYTPAPEPMGAEPEATPELEMGAAETLPDAAAKPAGDRPAPVDPAEAMAPNESGSVPSSIPRATLDHDSVLADYVPYEETDGPNWIEANERVGEIGGWREYARELYEPTPAMADDGDAR